MIDVTWFDKKHNKSREISLDSMDLKRLAKRTKVDVGTMYLNLREGKVLDTGLHTYKVR